MKIYRNYNFKAINAVEVKDNQAVYDKAKEVLTRVIENLDFINFKNSKSIDRTSSELRYTNVESYADEQLSLLSDYLFAAPFVVKVDDVKYYAMVIQIVTVENGINFRFIVFK